MDLADLDRSIFRPAKPSDSLFCADRVWDQRAEAGYMKKIEDSFQILADTITQNSAVELDPVECKIVSHFYALWHYRSRQRGLPFQSLSSGLVTEGLNDDQLELLESRGIMAVRHDGSVAARHINGLQIQILAGRFATGLLDGARWGVITATEGEFCVPDMPNHGIIPVTPSVALVKDSPSGKIIEKNLGEINEAMFLSAQDYVFARSFGDCPGLADHFQKFREASCRQ